MKTIYYGIIVICLATVFLTNCGTDPITWPPIEPKPPYEKEKLILSYPKTSYPSAQVLVTIDYLEMGSEHAAIVRWSADDYPYPQQLKKTETITSSNHGSYSFTFPSIKPDSYYYIKCNVQLGNSYYEKIISIHYPQ